MQTRRKEILIGLSLAIAVSLFGCYKAESKPLRHHKAHAVRSVPDANGNEARVIGGRPAGCPHAFCGCALAKFFGLDDRRLWLAWNWAKLFRRTHPHSGAVAVRRHHVMQLVEHIGGSRWMVRDYNGGKHLSWLHARDVRGYVFVDPSASVGMN